MSASSAALDRQIRPIYDALDTGSNKSAIVTCNKLLKKYPTNVLVKALKALALIRSQKVEESLVLCDEVLESKPTNEGVLTAMMHVLRGLGRHNDMVTMFDEAFKKSPGNEELGCQTFFAHVRASHWKSAHLIATRMNKTFQDEKYLYWSVICAMLQANDVSTPPTMRPILYQLAHRLIQSSPTPSYVSADRFHLHLSLLRQLGLYDEAGNLLDSDVGKSICATNLSCDELRREIWKQQGKTKEEGKRAEVLITEKRDRNWLEFLAVIEATFNEEDPEVLKESIKKTQQIFTDVAAQDSLKDRSSLLALIEVQKRAQEKGLSEDTKSQVVIMEEYFNKFGNKACCFEDLKPSIASTTGGDRTRWISFLESKIKSPDTIPALQTVINAHKLLRFGLTPSEITVESELNRVGQYVKLYFETITFGSNLPSTELQPGDDLVLLAVNALISAWRHSQSTSHLLSAIYLLEFALTKSKHCFLARLVLIRLYRLLGAPLPALEHYRALNIKQVQNDTLSHLILSRASTFSLASSGDLTLSSECLEATQIYLSNSQETGDFIVRAFSAEKYSQIPEFIAFEDRLDNSLQRDSVKMEHLRMRLTHEPVNSDVIDMELIELKFIFDRVHHDNRDFAIFPNYQPNVSGSLNHQTLLFGKEEGFPWLSAFLKVYIRILQQASDLDDTVEEKLLIGDRPKPAANSATKASLSERIQNFTPEERETLTTEEAQLVDYATSLSTWLGPYHDYARPPPAVVLAEAAKQTELKTGHPLKGIEIPPINGNGQQKKDEEPPTVVDAPERVSKHFDGIHERFENVKASGSVVDLLHIATLAQEAFILLITETTRFKSASVTKVNKFGALATNIKDLKTAAQAVLKEISTELIKKGEGFNNAEARKVCIEACNEEISTHVSHDFILNLAKKISDSRFKILDGVGKGIVRVIALHA
ncbi:N-acetyltransferase B complex non catalytic subunit-domain-containing protein [Panaeolus papilionaceus]|nr:N-acetyltransferase B complex non catalytic subunit-domain-containing protein [Panaeolus papilionaceus]